MTLNVYSKLHFKVIRSLCILLISFSVCYAEAQSGILNLRHFNKTVTSFQANFHQKIFNEKQKMMEDTAGIMYLQRPGKFRWEYKHPYNHLIVADGDKIWLHDQELESVTVKPLNEGIGNTPALILSSRRPLEDSFYVREYEGDKNFLWVKLIPKSPTPNFDYVLLAFNKDSSLQIMKLIDKLGQTTVIEFSAVVINPNLQQRLFRFTPPPGSDIVGSEG